VRVLLLTTAFMSVLALPRLHGQAPPRSDATLVFEAASVKPNQSRNCERDGSLAGGRFVMTCAALRELIVFAYPRQDGRLRFETEVTGGPSWINADHFDVVAKAPEGQGVGIDAGNTAVGATPAAELSAIGRIRQMAQALLADRFKVTVHHELRDLAVYELRTDRKDGTPGPQLKKVDVDCVSQRGSGRPCGGFRTIAPGHIVAHAVTMALFAQYLEMPVSRNIFDRSGLQGTFDVELQYTPDRLQLRGPEAPASDPAGVSVFTAVREQLGLKLESTKAPIDVLVIDNAEKPTPD
jgi:uncharacterized protein (TIGR03435 family)